MRVGDLIQPVIDDVLDFVYLWDTSNFSGLTWNPAYCHIFTFKELGIVLYIVGEDISKEVHILTSTGWAHYDKVKVVHRCSERISLH